MGGLTRLNPPATKQDNVDVEVCEEIEGLSITDTPNIIGEVANFSSEAGICATVPYDAGTSAFTPSVEGYQDLKEYFSRPRMIASGTVPTTRSRLWGASVGFASLVSWFPNFLLRTEGAYGVRFSLKVMVTVAANPFQQALLALSYQHGVEENDTEIYARSSDSATVTNLPHVLLNLAETTMVELEIPYLSVHDFVNLRTAVQPTLGFAALNTLLPYRTLTNSTPPTYKVYVSLHDLELIGSYPSVANVIVPQSGLHDKKPDHASHGASRDKSAPEKGGNKITQEAKSTGSISGLMNKVAKGVRVASAVALPFAPELSAIGGATDWFLRSASKVVSAFGYSKPVVEKESDKMILYKNVGDINIDLPMPGYVVAPFQSNKLRVDSTLGDTEIDEMALAFVLKKYSQIFVGVMSTSDATGARIYGTMISMNNFWFRTNPLRPGGNIPLPLASSLTTNAIIPSTLLFVSNMFRYWRGSLKFRFTFSKTKFHAGRVMVGYVPDFVLSQNGTPVSNVAEAPEVTLGLNLPQPFSYCEIFDFRDSSVFEFEVPFVSPFLYANMNDNVGGLSMTIVDPILANGEASTAIDFMVEVCAGDDFEFACAVPPTLTPAAITGTVTLQSGLGGVGEVPANVSEYTVGEKFDSLKQLMMLPSYVGVDVANNALNACLLPPWFYRPRFTMATPMAIGSGAHLAFTRSGNISSCYAFVNGSTVWHLYNDLDSKVSFSIAQLGGDGGFTTTTMSDPRWRDNYGTGCVRLYETSDTAHAVLPLYSKTARVIPGRYNASYTTRNWAPNITPTNTTEFSNVQYQLLTRNNSGSTVRVVLGRAAADDARCAVWIGPPPVILFASTQTATPDLGQIY